jgi:hypothetical protein
MHGVAVHASSIRLGTFLVMRFRWRRNLVGFDEAVFGTMAAGMEKLVAAGLDESGATGAAANALMQAADGSASRVAATLQQRAPRMLRARERHTRIFNRVLRVYWGEALDRYLAICVAAEEVGTRFHDRLAGAAVEYQDHSFHALTGLYARACRTAFEIHHALAGGFPMGALARCRTLHEIAVIMMVVSEFGEEHADLAERFLLHEVVQNWKDAKIYQEHCAALGTEPFTDDEMADMERDRQELLVRFDDNYRCLYGWVSGVAGLVNPSFADLESSLVWPTCVATTAGPTTRCTLIRRVGSSTSLNAETCGTRRSGRHTSDWRSRRPGR